MPTPAAAGVTDGLLSRLGVGFGLDALRVLCFFKALLVGVGDLLELVVRLLLTTTRRSMMLMRSFCVSLGMVMIR